MKPNAFIPLVLLFASVCPLTVCPATQNADGEAKVNVGIKAGFNSSMFSIGHFTVGGNELENIQNNYKVGYFGALFCRFNLKKHHFLQTEFSYNVLKGSISISNSMRDNIALLQDNALVKTDINSIDIPLLYGYKFVDTYPYGMSFFVGPKVSYVWDAHSRSEYSGFYQQNIMENMRPFQFIGVVGLAVNVSNIFFDFRYEMGFHNIVRSVTFDTEQTSPPYDGQDIHLERRRNALSFSVGLIF